MSYTRNIALNTLAQYLGKGVIIAVSVIVTALLTRNLGVTGYGQYVFIFSLVMFANNLADWGSTFIATREAARHTTDQSSLYFTSLATRFAASLVFFLLFLLVARLFPELRLAYLSAFAAAFLIPLTSLKMSLQVVFQSQFQLWRLSLIDTLSSLFFLFFLLTLTQTFNVPQIFLFLNLAALAALTVGLFLARRYFTLPLRFDLHFAHRLVRQSLTMGLLLTIFSIYNRLDVFLLERLQGLRAVGIYGLSYKVFENLLVGAAFLANATFPLLSSRSRNLPLFKQAFEKYLATLLVLGLSAALLAYIFAPFIIRIIGGPDFAPAAASLRLLSLALIGAFLAHATGYALVALDQQTLSVKIALVALVFNLSANLIFIPRYSYLASAAITGLTELIIFLLEIFFLTRLLGGLDLLSGLKALSPRSLLQSLKSK